jgi:hypothetical protein
VCVCVCGVCVCGVCVCVLSYAYAFLRVVCVVVVVVGGEGTPLLAFAPARTSSFMNGSCRSPSAQASPA